MITTRKHRIRRTRRLAVGVACLGSGAALMLTPMAASGAPSILDGAPQINITQTPVDPQPVDCVAPELAVLNPSVLTNFVSADSAEFRVTIRAFQPLCAPLTATAAVYSMPGGLAQPWPQTLKDSTTFTIREAGDTVVTFLKDCDPVQFDVLAGAFAPPRLDTGFDHQLLFLADLNTSYQHPGISSDECVESTTTVAPTTTAEVVTTTTAAVQGTTTIAEPAPTSVLGNTTIPSSSNTGTSPSALAATGSTTTPLALIGGGLVLIGVASLVASRPRYL